MNGKCNARPVVTFSATETCCLAGTYFLNVAWWSLVQLPAVLLTGNDFGQVVHTHVPLSPSSIIWWSGVALAMRHRL